MPILDPATQNQFLQLASKKASKFSKQFFIRYLKIASRNLYRNFQTIEASIQFKTDLKNSTSFLNSNFGCRLNKSDFNDDKIKDYYRFLYQHIDHKYTSKMPKEQKGNYAYMTDGFGFELNYFQPFIDYSRDHSWFLLEHQVAVLAINTHNSLDLKKEENLINLCNLETDLMIASGFTVVLCVGNVHSLENLIIELVSVHPFAEIYFNLPVLEDEDVISFFNKLHDNYNKTTGYIYVYSPKIEKYMEWTQYYKQLMKKPRFKCTFFTDIPNHALKKLKSYPREPFVYSKTGFEDEQICIRLCNVPLYRSDNEKDDFSSTLISGFTFGFISASDYLSIEKLRVKIVIEDPTNKNHYIRRYVNFDDIHHIKDDSYVEKTLYMAKTELSSLTTVEKMSRKVQLKVKNNEKFKKETIMALFKKSKMKKGLKYVAYAFVKNAEKVNRHFKIHENQLLTALEACQTCLFKEKRTNKGVIYQVDTGEGKSCIIQIVAAVLALMKKVVHITSSNINLSNRDYYNSFGFFKKLGIQSAVLLHYNELPYINLSNSFDEEIEFDKKFFPDKFFHQELFNNASNMNFAVCGINNDNEFTKDRANVIFSTFINFEGLYLRMMETCPGYVFDYFRGCSLLIDEADSILIDELTNGTILSRTIKSNGDDILKFVYKSKMEGASPEFVLNSIKETWPNCIDLSIDDVQTMYQEIDLVNREEFVDGKKYIIETIELKEKTSLTDMLKNAQDNVENVKEKCKEETKKFFFKLFKRNKKKKTEHKDEEPKEEEHKEHKDEEPKDEEHKDEEPKEEKKKKHRISFSKKDKNKSKSKNKNKNKVKIKDENQDENESNENESENENEEKQEKKSNKRRCKVIIPFDYDHKGILEPNKEFSGFVQQFIAIKEMTNNPEENSNMIIKNVSMNYLFVSHPIFVKLYDGVVGLTGTIGNKYDKEILKDQYKLVTMKIPRNMPNLRVEYPPLLCSDIEERDQKIVEEVLHFHSKDYPVLVIFQDLNEISYVLYLLIEKGIKNVNIFDGKDEKVKPDLTAGLKGAISLGTNACGRGTDIQKPDKPLHVIVTYFTSNARVLHQAFGRTARQGHKGSVRIICLESQFFIPIDQFNEKEIDSTLDDFKFKNKMQLKFIEKFKKDREWIFLGGIKSQKLTREVIHELRSVRINVNRLVACNFEFPICMSIETFLSIQAQKIFSLFNCPNCKYTWRLFQQYIREMILESWSLFIDKAERNYYKEAEKTLSYSEYLKNEIQGLVNLLKEYLPDCDNNPENYEIVPTFMHIFNKVRGTYERKIMEMFKGDLVSSFIKNEEYKFCTFAFGFRPYALLDESGAKINNIDGNDEGQQYISDPELKYMKQMPDGHSVIISITEKIDGIFNWICNKINEVLGAFMGLKFFLRRTLAGCEFGVCFNFDLENEIPPDKIDYNCLIDQDPLLIFTINVRSMIPILAGILIIGLVYIASISESLFEWITMLPIKLTKEIKKTLVEIGSIILSSQIEVLCDAVCSFLSKILFKQINEIEKFDHKMARIFMIMLNIAVPKDFASSGDYFCRFFSSSVRIKMKNEFVKMFIRDRLPFPFFAKIGFLLLLCFASFMMKFHFHRQAVKYDTEKVAEKYDEEQKPDVALEENQSVYQLESDIVPEKIKVTLDPEYNK